MSAQIWVRDALEVAPQNDCLDKFRIVVNIVEQSGCRFEPSFHFDESGALQRMRCRFRINIKPRLLKVSEESSVLRRGRKPSHPLPQAGQVGTTTTLGFQPSAWAQRSMQAAKQAGVVQNPMKRRGADNTVERPFKRKFPQISHNEAHSAAELRLQVIARG